MIPQVYSKIAQYPRMAKGNSPNRKKKGKRRNLGTSRKKNREKIKVNTIDSTSL